MIQTIKHIQDFLNGKSKKEIEQAIASKKLSFDTNKYMIARTPKTLSGYTIIFTKNYKTEMLSLLNDKFISNNVLIKLDNILSEDYKLTNHKKIQLYLTSENIIKGIGLEDVDLYKFTTNNGLEKDLLTINGELVKGSLSMALRTSEFLENKYEETINRQDDIIDLFDIERELAADLVNKFRTLENEEFDEILIKILAISETFINKFSLCELSFKHGIKSELYNTNRVRITNALLLLVGNNEEQKKLIKTLIGKNTLENVEKTRNILLNGCKQTINEILLNESKDEFIDYVYKLGKYDFDKYTANLTIAADILNIQEDVIDFIVNYCDKKELQHYFTETFFNKNTKQIETRRLPSEIEEKIVNSIFEEKHNISNVSRKIILMALNPIKSSNLNAKNKETIESLFINRICKVDQSKKEDISMYIRNIALDKTITQEQKMTLLKEVIMKKDEQSFKHIVRGFHPLFNQYYWSDIIKDLKKEKELNYDKMQLIFKKYYQEFEFYKMDEIYYIKFKNKIYDYDIEQNLELSKDLKQNLLIILENEEFKEQCKEIIKKIIKEGLSEDFIENKINVHFSTINDEEALIVFSSNDKKHYFDYKVDNFTFSLINEKKTLTDCYKKIKILYNQLLEIQNNETLSEKEKIEHSSSLLHYSSTICNPDIILLQNITDNEKIQLASNNDNPEPNYILVQLIDNNAKTSLKTPELVELSRMIRKLYADKFVYEGILNNKQQLYFDNLFTPQIYSIEDGTLGDVSNAIVDKNGNVYMNTKFLFHSKSLEEIYRKKKEKEEKSHKITQEFFENYDMDLPSFVAQKIKILTEYVKNESINRTDLFRIISNINPSKDEDIIKVKMICDKIDQYCLQDLIKFQKEQGISSNLY